MLDHKSYPHIVDTIIAHSDHNTTLAWRATSRQYHDHVDKRLFTHILFAPPPSSDDRDGFYDLQDCYAALPPYNYEFRSPHDPRLRLPLIPHKGSLLSEEGEWAPYCSNRALGFTKVVDLPSCVHRTSIADAGAPLLTRHLGLRGIVPDEALNYDMDFIEIRYPRSDQPDLEPRFTFHSHFKGYTLSGINEGLCSRTSRLVTIIFQPKRRKFSLLWYLEYQQGNMAAILNNVHKGLVPHLLFIVHDDLHIPPASTFSTRYPNLEQGLSRLRREWEKVVRRYGNARHEITTAVSYMLYSQWAKENPECAARLPNLPKTLEEVLGQD